MKGLLKVLCLAWLFTLVLGAAAIAGEAPPLPASASPDVLGERVYLVHKLSKQEFQVISKFNAKEQVVWTFSEKAWGTWNIFWLTLSDNDSGEPITMMQNRRNVAGGGTDWEYVYHGGPRKGGPMEWMGGNHGNEELVALTVIGDDEQIEIKKWPVGKSGTFGRVQIKEETHLVNPNMEGVVGTVTRLYDVVPNGLRMTTTTEWLQDMWLDIGYAAMYPVSKEYGRRWKFGGVDKIFTVPGMGETTSRFYGFLDAIETTFWGDAEPDVRTRGWIADRAAVLDWKYTVDKTRVWDIGTTQVKLYYAIFSNKGAALMPKGTRWEVLKGWDIWREAAGAAQ